MGVTHELWLRSWSKELTKEFEKDLFKVKDSHPWADSLGILVLFPPLFFFQTYYLSIFGFSGTTLVSLNMAGEANHGRDPPHHATWLEKCDFAMAQNMAKWQNVVRL